MEAGDDASDARRIRRSRGIEKDINLAGVSIPVVVRFRQPVDVDEGIEQYLRMLLKFIGRWGRRNKNRVECVHGILPDRCGVDSVLAKAAQVGSFNNVVDRIENLRRGDRWVLQSPL